MDEHGPDAAPDGALTPAPRYPGGAVAASASLAPSAPPMSRVRTRQRGLRGLVDAALDGLDTLADRIAEAAGLR